MGVETPDWDYEKKVQPKKSTMDLAREIVEDAKRARKSWSWCWHHESDGDTVVIVVENPERRAPHGILMVPGFYVAKVCNGSLLSETFV